MGVEEQETIDDGSLSLRKSQADVKFKALAQRGKLSKEELEAAAVLDEEVSSDGVDL